MGQDNLKQKVSKGLLWNTIHNLSMKGIQFLLMLFMARLLSPDDYGTVGLLAIFIQFSTSSRSFHPICMAGPSLRPLSCKSGNNIL